MARTVYWIVSVLVCHQARDGCQGAPLGDSAASGAGKAFVALSLDLDQGAQRDFNLFYPELQETTPTTPELRETVKSPIEEQKIIENPNKRRKESSDVISSNSSNKNNTTTTTSTTITATTATT